MPTTKPSTFTILLIEDNGGDVEMFLRAVEHELPRHEDEEVELLINATAEGGLSASPTNRSTSSSRTFGYPG